MEHSKETEQLQPQQESYIPRPAWQVWGSRITLVLFLILVAAQILSIAGGGL